MTVPSPTPRTARESVDGVTAVVVNHQGAAYLPRCLDALEGQEGLAEILVIDNASTDGSAAAAAARGGLVRLVEAGGNLGPAAARNLGLAQVRTPWVLFVDNDVYLPEGAVASLLAAAQDEPRVALVQPRSVFAGEPTRVHYDGGSLHHLGLFSLRNWYGSLDCARAADPAPRVAVDGAISLCLLGRVDALRALGGFDPRYFILFEDLDLSYRVRAAGWRILSLPGVLVEHDAGTAGVSFREGARYPARRVFLHARNRWRFLLKNLGLRSLLLTLPSQALYEVAYLFLALRHRALGSWLRGKGAALASLGEVWRARAAVQATRVVGDRELLVGGPLTLTPDAGAREPAARFLDGWSRLCFRLVRPLL